MGDKRPMSKAAMQVLLMLAAKGDMSMRDMHARGLKVSSSQLTTLRANGKIIRYQDDSTALRYLYALDPVLKALIQEKLAEGVEQFVLDDAARMEQEFIFGTGEIIEIDAPKGLLPFNPRGIL